MHRFIARAAFVLLGLAVSSVALAQAASVPGRSPVQQPALKQQSAPAARSAQSNCVREANRRGFAVLDTSNFRQTHDGWSIDMRVRDSRGRVQTGSCFVETRTGDVDLYGFGWGWDDGGDDRIEFNCSSVEGKYRECQLPINGRARLVKKRSDAPCVENRSWGQRGDRVWVNNGCRAKFEVSRFGGSGGSGGGGGSANTVDCYSNGSYQECRIGSGRYGRLVRDLSNGRCREHQTYGTHNGVIWVNNGCRGRFEVRSGSGGSGGSGGSSGNLIGQQEARNACSSEVARRGHQVVHIGTISTSNNQFRMNLRVRQGASGPERVVGCQVDRSTGAAHVKW